MRRPELRVVFPKVNGPFLEEEDVGLKALIDAWIASCHIWSSYLCRVFLVASGSSPGKTVRERNAPTAPETPFTTVMHAKHPMHDARSSAQAVWPSTGHVTTPLEKKRAASADDLRKEHTGENRVHRRVYLDHLVVVVLPGLALRQRHRNDRRVGGC